MENQNNPEPLDAITKAFYAAVVAALITGVVLRDRFIISDEQARERVSINNLYK